MMSRNSTIALLLAVSLPSILHSQDKGTPVIVGDEELNEVALGLERLNREFDDNAFIRKEKLSEFEGSVNKKYRGSRIRLTLVVSQIGFTQASLNQPKGMQVDFCVCASGRRGPTARRDSSSEFGKS